MRSVAREHVPVLLEEVMSFLDPRPGGTYVDCTVGGGGHAREILAGSAPDGRLVGFDVDPEALALAGERLREFGDRVVLVKASYEDIGVRLRELEVECVDGILFDLGMSGLQLDESRGFSYAVDAPLDMRFDPGEPGNAADLLNTLGESELAWIFREYGEERWASRIARFVVMARARKPIRRTGELVEIIKDAIPAKARRKGPHPAKRTFQALRIAVNDELGRLNRALPEAAKALRPGGKMCVISFHSLEDRIVKSFFKSSAAGEVPGVRLEILTKKPVKPAPGEVESNPRARSAKLRAARRVG